ncbi:MAG: Inner membrane transport protein YajR [Anaerolineales bacterium]|nr:Inner membrane transport protein YajR [Anaerolineales bacterium]
MMPNSMLARISQFVNTEPEVVSLSFARMADALGNSLLIIVLPLYIARQPSPLFNLPTEFLVGLVISLYGFLFALGQPFAGAASDRTGKRKPFILAGLAVMAAATLGFTFADRYIWIILLRGLQGLGVALIIPAVLALITGATETRTRGNAMGVYSTFRMIGFATGPLMAGLLQVHFGFNAAFVVGAAFVAVAFLLVQFTVEDLPAAANPGNTHQPGQQPQHESSLIPSNSILTLMFSTIVLASSLSMMSALENEFNARLAQTAIGFGVAFSALTVSRLFVQIPIGRLSDRAGRKKLIVGGLLAMAPLTVLFGYVGTTVQLIGLRLVQGVATAGVAAPAFALAGDLAREGGEGREMSFVTMGFGLGLAIGPLVAGSLAGYLGFKVPFYVVGALSVMAAYAVWRYAEETVGPAGPVLRETAGYSATGVE